jgi:hypothetical protein
MANDRYAIAERFAAERVLANAASYINVTKVDLNGNSDEQLFPIIGSTLHRLKKSHPDIKHTAHGNTVDLSGWTVSHVMSITKSITGFVWAYLVFKSREYPNLRECLLSNGEFSYMARYIDQRHNTLPALEELKTARVKQMLTHTSGIVLKESGPVDIMEIITCSYKTKRAGESSAHAPPLFSLETVVAETLYSGVLHRNEFHYDNLLCQTVIIGLEELMRCKGGDDFMLKDYIIDNFIDQTARATMRDTWRVTYAGFNNEKNKPVFNTLGFWGVRMSGAALTQYGVFLMKNHLDVLLQIHDDPQFYVTLGEFSDDKKNKPSGKRMGWRYSFFWWIPRFAFDASTEKYKIVAAIGYQGQYLLMELTTGYVFVRQFFVKNALTENVDATHIKPADADKIRDAEFAYECIKTIQKLTNDI